MTVMARLERMFGRFAVPNLTLYIVCGQAAFLLMAIGQGDRFIGRVVLDTASVVGEGEWWRVATFVLVPPAYSSPLFAAFALYFFYIMGTALEANWGEFRFNLYLLIGYVVAVAGAFVAYALTGTGVAGNAEMMGSVFLAFAMLYPEYVIYLFFILPIPVKYLAWLTWLVYLVEFAMGGWMTRALVVASVLNFLLFFAGDIVQMMKHGRRRMERGVKRRIVPDPGAAFHTCAVCGITDKTHPKMDFRYCPGCGGKLAYCTEHLNNHEHRVVANDVKA